MIRRLLIFVASVSCVFTASVRERYYLDVESLKQLDAFELRQLRDFARGKGRGSVSRLPIDQLLNESSFREPDLDPNDPNVVSLGGGGSFGGSQQLLVPPPSVVAPIAPMTFGIGPGGPFEIKPASGAPQQPAVAPMRPIPTRIGVPSAKRGGKKEAAGGPSRDDFRQLESLLKEMIERRQRALSSTPPPTTTQPTLQTVPQTRLRPGVSGLQQTFKAFEFYPPGAEWKGSGGDARLLKRVASGAPATFPPASSSDWKSMDGLPDPDEEGQLLQPAMTVRIPTQPTQTQQTLPPSVVTSPTSRADLTETEWDERMTSLGDQLKDILNEIKKQKEQQKKKKEKKKHRAPARPQPIVTVLRNGSAEQTDDNRYVLISTVTLVRHNGMSILVDTGLGTDINGRTAIMNALSALNLAPPNVDVVVTTHGHPDHSGGIIDFPDAVHYMGWYSHHHNIFNLSALFENERHYLTDGVYLTKTPGHSSDDISVVVEDADRYGDVAITGDVFVRAEDSKFDMMWRPLSQNETLQAQSRHSLLCRSQVLIPGHGRPFAVTDELRAMYQC